MLFLSLISLRKLWQKHMKERLKNSCLNFVYEPCTIRTLAMYDSYIAFVPFVHDQYTK